METKEDETMNRQKMKDLEVAIAAAVASGRYKQKVELLLGKVIL